MSVGNSDSGPVGNFEEELESESSVGNLEESRSVGNSPPPHYGDSRVGNLEEQDFESVGNSPALAILPRSVGNLEEELESAPLAISPGSVGNSPALAISPARVGNSEEQDLDFAPASVGNLETLEIRSNWRWEFRMRKTVFGIYILERGKDRTPVMYLGPQSPDPKSREQWKQFLPEYEKWSQNGFKRRVKYTRPVPRNTDVMV